MGYTKSDDKGLNLSYHDAVLSFTAIYLCMVRREEERTYQMQYVSFFQALQKIYTKSKDLYSVFRHVVILTR